MEFEDFKNIVEQDTYVRDKITYTIYTTFVDKHYWGWWFCETCKENHPSNRAEDSIEKAIISAKTCTGGHHYFKHIKK